MIRVSLTKWQSLRSRYKAPMLNCPKLSGEGRVGFRFLSLKGSPLASSVNYAIASSSDIRAAFLAYFKERGHTLVAPSIVYPRSLEGSYFINAGMNQFKPIFMSNRKDPAGPTSDFSGLKKAANSQPCIRIGGLHDDLNTVGYDSSHHTMFEMLGNWSFGAYDKEVACRQMWNFLTTVLGLPPRSLYITIFGGDDELGIPMDKKTEEIWRNLGVPSDRILRMDASNNFWCADDGSDGGLCGPCTEIHVDYRALSPSDESSCAHSMINVDGGRVVELWNCVFITHRFSGRSGKDGKPAKRDLIPLPNMSVDTGMGLERLTAVIQGKSSSFETNIFTPLMNSIHTEAQQITGRTVPRYGSMYILPSSSEMSKFPDALNLGHGHEKSLSSPTHPNAVLRDVAYRLIADHSRALSLALQDGLMPSRQGVGLKLRHLIHRATRAAVLTGLDSSTDPRLLTRVITQVPRAAPFKADVEGPLARPPTPLLSPEQISEIVSCEVRRFAPRLEELEKAFLACLQDGDNLKSLSARQVEGLFGGRYGEPVSWDMICAQARWYGLPNPPEPSTQPQSPSFTSSGSRRVSSTTSSSSSPSEKISQALRPLLSGIPVTQDHQKYQTQRRIDSQSKAFYEVPPLPTKLVGLVIAASSTPLLVTDSSQFHQLLVDHSTENRGRLGLVFDRTNFFSPCGGQATDVGSIRHPGSQRPLFDVRSVEKVASNNSGDGWVIHWVEPLEDFHNQAPTESFLLCPDSERRTSLMRNHTAQHLLNWAFSKELTSSNQETSGLSTSVHHGSRVDADRFILRLTLLEDLEEMEDRVESVEARCCEVINAKLPIVYQEVDMDAVKEKTFVKRFAWETYPQTVRAVCVGGSLETIEKKLDEASTFCSAELCGGTHLAQTEDLVDLVIVGLRSRSHSIKEFIGISGESATRVRQYGEKVLVDISNELHSITTDFQRTTSSTEQLLECADRLAILHSQIDAALSGAASELPFRCRCELARCLEKLSRLQGSIKASLRAVAGFPETVDPLMTLQLQRKLNENSDVVKAFNVSSFNKLAISLLHLAPKSPFVLYQKGLAVFYHPETDKALGWAKATVERMELGGFGVTSRVETFKRGSLGNKADHFAVVRLVSAQNNQRQANWQRYLGQLNAAVTAALV